MITIINKYTGEVITKYSGALIGESTEDSFIANAKGSGTFRGRWNAIVEYFIPLKGFANNTGFLLFPVSEPLFYCRC